MSLFFSGFFDMPIITIIKQKEKWTFPNSHWAQIALRYNRLGYTLYHFFVEPVYAPDDVAAQIAHYGVPSPLAHHRPVAYRVRYGWRYRLAYRHRGGLLHCLWHTYTVTAAELEKIEAKPVQIMLKHYPKHVKHTDETMITPEEREHNARVDAQVADLVERSMRARIEVTFNALMSKILADEDDEDDDGISVDECLFV